VRHCAVPPELPSRPIAVRDGRILRAAGGAGGAHRHQRLVPAVPVEPVLEPVVPELVVEPGGIVPGVVAVPEAEALEPESVVEAEPDAPMDVPLPVVAPAVVSVLVLGGVTGVVLAVLLLLVVSLGVVGVVLEVVEVVSSCLLQALRDRAAIRARAAHCAIGDLIIRNSLIGSKCEKGDSGSRCLRLTLVVVPCGRVICH